MLHTTNILRADGSSDSLQSLRQDVDCIDDQLLDLLAQRSALTRRIGALKEAHPATLPIRPRREAEIVERLTARAVLPGESVRAVWRAILTESARAQRPYSLCLWAPEPARPALADLARQLHGSAVPLRWATGRADAIAAARSGSAIALIAWDGDSGATEGLDLIGQYETGDPTTPWAAALGLLGLDEAKPECRDWAPSSWTARPHSQLPSYHSPALVAEVEGRLAAAEPIVDLETIAALKEQIAAAQRGERLILQGGDCAEPVDSSRTDVLAMASLIEAAAARLEIGIGRPVTSIGRIAGQYAKPRSTMAEHVGDMVIPAYRGDAVNGHLPTWADRKPDPRRLELAHAQSRRVVGWLGGARRRLHTSHEALLLSYEAALTRHDANSNRWFNRSADTLWLGERTRQPGGAHVEYLRGIANPIGIKCGPSMTGDDLIALLEALNPTRESGRIMLVCRAGVDRARESLPGLVEAVVACGHPVAWLVDPMHGNGRTAGGVKYRAMDDVLGEIAQAASALRGGGARLAGLHLEVTPEPVTECVDHLDQVGEPRAYTSRCDPRLNPGQTMRVIDALIAALVGEQGR